MNDPITLFALVLLGAALLLGGMLVRRRDRERNREQDPEEREEALARALSPLREHLEREAEQAERRARANDALLRTLTDTLSNSLREEQSLTRERLLEQLGEIRAQQDRTAFELREQIQENLSTHRVRFEQRQTEAVNTLQEGLQSGMAGVRREVTEALARSAGEVGKRFEGLTETTDRRLKEISAQVERRLGEGFEKTTATFADVLTRLALIDEAQKKITELSTSVVSLQEVLADKRSRGAFGEIQLAGLIRNILPEQNFALQYTLSNKKVADCVLFLPPPTGTIAIDAKFPLESYRRMTDVALGENDRRGAERQFKQDVRKHIQDIAARYIIPGETAEGAVMFIPAEAVFAEIQAHQPELVEAAWALRVWMVSPTTLMAVLNTARAVLKDAATREQVHAIQRHLAELSQDFGRFQTRMENLARHIRLAGKDVDEVHTSARKITERFDRIERVELEG
uniref:DNA recombination protein RmuC n=1 Tax=Candidatus Kentrum sp. FM TaxID=2126340 RepID=A0A450VQV2_9GAMM|nr:MAG: DNA recombination protein RmuC [Candidatus Kentron sp. FM]VFJ47264.1 MAG: DNA recombination protein RmuC [Candidatus Kentron sp. FM]VFK07159.1 MAG: DNA recombination protein RmuC [Candidatus Kentron sp. FM]